MAMFKNFIKHFNNSQTSPISSNNLFNSLFFTLKKSLFINTNKYFSTEVLKAKQSSIPNIPKAKTSNEKKVKGPPKYIPLEKQTPKQRKIAKTRMKRELYYYYGSKHIGKATKLYPVWEAYAKKKRLGYLNSIYLEGNSLNIKVKRLRSCHEDIISLHTKGEIAVKIAGREEFPELNFILDLKTLNNLVK